jgi:hypothetical protein
MGKREIPEMSRRPPVRYRSTRSSRPGGAGRRRGPGYVVTVLVAIALVWGAGQLAVGGIGEGQDRVPPAAQSTAPVPAPAPVPEPVPVPAPALSGAEALALLGALPDAGYTDDGGYAGNREELFGRAWAFDFDRNGCDTRNDILTRDLTDTDIDVATCRVYSGSLTDPYSGETIGFVRGQDTSADVQIDHLLPLKAVWATGGAAWPAEKREALANDPINLIAVKGSENASKSDSLPSDWLPGYYPDVSDRHDLGQRVAWDDLPEDTTLQCWYVDRLVPVFVAYELGVTPEDRAAMTAVLESCD